MLALAVGLFYVAFVARGVRRSYCRGNIMASTFRRRHSWRWWVWTACGRPTFWTEGLPTSRAGVWILRRQVPLPLALFPAHYRRPLKEQLLVEVKQAYVRGYKTLAEYEEDVETILRSHWMAH